MIMGAKAAPAHPATNSAEAARMNRTRSNIKSPRLSICCSLDATTHTYSEGGPFRADPIPGLRSYDRSERRVADVSIVATEGLDSP